jgi:hypothetical protein
VQESIEPMLIGTHLLQRIQYKPGMTTVFPAIEPLRADEAGDGMDLPIYNINIGGAQSFGAAVQRNGLRPKIAKRFVDESSYPWITRSRRPLPQHQPSRARVKKVLLNCSIDAVSITPTYRKPFDMIFERAKRKEWSGREDLNLRPPGPEPDSVSY